MDERMPKTAEEAAALAAAAGEEGHGFLFSVVIAVYNAERDLAEAIDSVVNQTIGFEHTQVVLVNDGSSDGSEAICREYERRFPGNVTVVSQQNAGVSAARNAGIALATGKYLNFLDSDDLWSEDAFGWALAFFEEHPDVPFAASRYVYFGAKEGDHRLNYKFKETRVIDVSAEYDSPQLSSSTCFFKAETLRGRAYDETLSVSEDTLLMNEILIDEMRYGVMSKPVYHYRQHADKSESAIGSMKRNVSWYFDTPKACYARLFELSREKHGRVLPFVQFTVMYDLQWRIRAKPPVGFTDEQLAEYKRLLVDLLREIDDDMIGEQRTISIDQVANAFSLKYGVPYGDILDGLAVEDGLLISRITDWRGEHQRLALRPIDALSDSVTIEGIQVDRDTVTLHGLITSFRFKPRDVVFEITANNRPLKVEVFETDDHRVQNPFDQNIVGKTGFTCAIPLGAGEQVRLKTSFTLLGSVRRTLRFRTFTPATGFPKKYQEGAFVLASDIIMQLGAPEALTIQRLPHDLSAEEAKALYDEAETYRTTAEVLPQGKYQTSPWQSLE